MDAAFWLYILASFIRLVALSHFAARWVRRTGGSPLAAFGTSWFALGIALLVSLAPVPISHWWTLLLSIPAGLAVPVLTARFVTGHWLPPAFAEGMARFTMDWDTRWGGILCILVLCLWPVTLPLAGLWWLGSRVICRWRPERKPSVAPEPIRAGASVSAAFPTNPYFVSGGVAAGPTLTTLSDSLLAGLSGLPAFVPREPEERTAPLYGWRRYEIIPYVAAEGMVLKLTGAREIWEHRTMTAQCHGDPTHWTIEHYETVARGHLATQSCSCGIYVLKDVSPADGIDGILLTAVSMEGIVVEHEYGYRAERVTIERVFAGIDPDADREAVAVRLLRMLNAMGGGIELHLCAGEQELADAVNATRKDLGL